MRGREGGRKGSREVGWCVRSKVAFHVTSDPQHLVANHVRLQIQPLHHNRERAIEARVGLHRSPPIRRAVPVVRLRGAHHSVL